LAIEVPEHGEIARGSKSDNMHRSCRGKETKRQKKTRDDVAWRRIDDERTLATASAALFSIFQTVQCTDAGTRQRWNKWSAEEK